MKILIILFFFCAISNSFCQKVGQWLHIRDIEQNIINATGPMSTSKSKHLALITSTVQRDNILLLSDDGGNTWFETRRDSYYYYDSTTLPKPTLHQREYQAVERPSENHIIILVRDNIQFEGGLWLPYIYLTSNKGHSWDTIEISSKKSKAYSTYRLSMLNSNYGIVRIFLYDSTLNTDIYCLFKTLDGGRNWEIMKLPIDSTNNLYGPMQILSQDEFIIFNGKEFHYFDLNTNSYKIIKLPLNNFRSFSITPSYIIYAVGGIPTGMGAQERSIIYKTSDFGITWHKLIDSLYTPDNGLNYVNFFDDLNGVAVGGLSRILRTNDGGLNWFLDPPPFPYYQVQFKSVNYFDKNQCVLLSDKITKFNGQFVMMPPNLANINHPDSLTNFTFKWSKIDDAIYYHLQVSEYFMDENVGYFPANYLDRLVIDTLILDQNEINFRGVIGFNKKCYARIKAFNYEDTSDWSSMLIFQSPKDPSGNTISAPFLIYPPNGAINLPIDVTFQWSSVYGADSYTLYITKNQPKLDSTSIIIQEIKSTHYTIKKLEPEQLYYWWISSHAIDKNPGVTGWRAFKTGSITSFQEKKDYSKFLISPNPANEFIEIVYYVETGLRPVSIEEVNIYNILGECVVSTPALRATPQEGNLRVDISNLPSGIYYVLLGDWVGRFVKI